MRAVSKAYDKTGQYREPYFPAATGNKLVGSSYPASAIALPIRLSSIPFFLRIAPSIKLPASCQGYLDSLRGEL